MRRPELTPARRRSRRAHHADATRRRLIGGSRLSVHALRHTYVTNLIEWGYAEKFVQDQVGHAYASTTAIYTSVGDDYKNRMIAKALSRVYGGPDDTTQ